MMGVKDRFMEHDSQVSPLDSHVGYWLRVVSNHVSHAFARKLEAEGVTVAEWGLLRELLHLGETSPYILAKSIGMTRGAVSKLLDRLVDKNYVDRWQSDGDRRYQRVELTAVGHTLVPYLAEKADTNDAEFFGHLDDAQKAALINLLKEADARHGSKEKPVK